MNAYLRRKQRIAKLASERGKRYRAAKKEQTALEIGYEIHNRVEFELRFEQHRKDAAEHEKELGYDPQL